MTEVLVILLAVFVGVFTQRLVGFGMPIIVLPAVLVFFPPASALVITLLIGIISSILILHELRRKDKINFKIIITLLPASAIGVITGAYVLTIMSKEALQIFLGLSILVFLNLERHVLIRKKRKIKIEKNIHFYGLLSGFFKSTVGLSAAPLMIWMRLYVIRPDQIRILMSYYFLIMNTVAIISIQLFEKSAIANIHTYLFLLIIPATVVANHLGSKMANKVNEKSYHRLAYIVLMIAGAITLASGLNSALN